MSNEDDLMRRYLLDLMPTEERDRVDARLGADPEFFDEMAAYEEDLIFCWSRGQLDNHTRSQFERAYAGDHRQARIRRILRMTTVVAAEAVPAPRGMVWWTLAASLTALVAATITIPKWGPSNSAGGSVSVDLAAVGERGPGPAKGFDEVRLDPGISAVVLRLILDGPVGLSDIVAEVSAVDREASRDYRVPALGFDPLTRQLSLTVRAGDLPDGDYLLTVRRSTHAQEQILRRQPFRVSRDRPR